jgi:hypothetical protein
MRQIASTKGYLGALFFINAVTIFTLVDKTNNSPGARYVTIVNLILAVLCFYFAFKLESLVKNHFNFVKYTIWFGLLYSIITSLLTRLVYLWMAALIIISIVVIYKLGKLKKEITASSEIPVSPSALPPV